MRQSTYYAHQIAEIVEILTDDRVACNPAGAIMSLHMKQLVALWRGSLMDERAFDAPLQARLDHALAPYRNLQARISPLSSWLPEETAADD